MRIVSENSEADIARNTATADVYKALRELTANLLRATRGAGRAWEIGRQAQALIESLIEYREVVGAYPLTEEITDALAIWRNQDDLENLSDEHYEQASAKQAVIRGALRIVAARLLDQGLQGAAGESEMYRGLGRLEAIRTERRNQGAPTATPSAPDTVKSAIKITIFPGLEGGHMWSANHDRPPTVEANLPPAEDHETAEAWASQWTHRIDRSREPIAMARKPLKSVEAATRAAKRWLKSHGYNDKTSVTIAGQPRMAERLDASIDSERFPGWGIAPVSDLLTAACRIGPFGIEGNIAADSYFIELLFEDGSAFILEDSLVGEAKSTA